MTGAKKNTPKTCEKCGAEYLGWNNTKRNKHHYCSHSCAVSAPRTNRKNVALRMSDGYLCRYLPEHPSSNIKGLYAEHRLVMEKHIGRLLTKKEVIHHIDGDVSNNSIDNLMLFACNGDHTRYHKEQRRIAKQNATAVSP